MMMTPAESASEDCNCRMGESQWLFFPFLFVTLTNIVNIHSSKRKTVGASRSRPGHDVDVFSVNIVLFL